MPTAIPSGGEMAEACGCLGPRRIIRGLERFPITWNHVIEKEALKFRELEHVLIEKVEQLFRGHALGTGRSNN